MGGKTKHAPRTKNNAKPSSSSRSAELLGSTPNFVGFSAHSDLGLVPLAPGFTTAEQISETLESKIGPEFQLILKKTTKKDPMTKKKAVQEFIALINQSDLKEVKAILPIWPKFYQNLANDPNYSIRELAQTTLQLLVSKCKKAVAPFLKQLVPVWVASQFDNYAPAASTASTSFAETFVHNNDRTCEVLLHCKDEIMGYVTQNLTYHTVATLSGKNISVEEAEQKYQRVVMWSLKELSFFVEHTANCKEVSQIQDQLGKLLSHQKFWSFTKSTLNPIRAAIFEFMYNLLVHHKELINPYKGQLIMVTFQKIDESDPLVVPHIWGCILLLQVNFPDWYQIIDFQKVVWPKFCSLVRKNFNGNAPAICPHILPFFSQLSQVNLSTEKYHNLIKEFFDNFKCIITAENPSMSKSQYAAIVKTYYECLRYFMQKFVNELNDERENNHDILLKLMEENVIDLLKWCLKGTNTISVKQCFLHTSALIAFLDRQQVCSKYYENLLSMFWHSLDDVTSESIGLMSEDVDELVLKNLIQLISDLHAATPILEEHKVTFIKDFKDLGGKDCNEGIKSHEKAKVNTSNMPKYSCDAATFVHKELKGIAVRLFKTCLQKILHLGNSEFIKYIRPITVMFNDENFFCEITEEGSLEAALTYMYKILELFVDKFDNTDYEGALEVMEVIFQILQHQDKSKRFKFIENPLIQLPHRATQVVLLERLLSHPWCVEPEVRVILSQPEIKRLISELVYDGVQNNSKDLYSILHKCFNQMDNGDILIHSDTITDIIGHLSDVLLSPPVAGVIDLDGCASFLSLFFPVVCDKHNKYCSQAIQNKAFLSLLKTQLLNCSVNNITPDTILEVMTCWQHALSDGFTITDDLLNVCAEFLKELLQQENLTCQLIHEYANIVAKLVLYSKQHITDDNEHLGCIDGMLKVLLAFDVQAAEDLMNTSLFVESINSLATPCRNFAPISCSITQMEKTFKMALFNFTTIKLLLQSDVKDGDTDEMKPCLPGISKLTKYVTNELLQYIQLAATAECFINCIKELDDPFKCLMNELCASVRDLFQNIHELGIQLKESLLTGFCDRRYNYAGCLLYLQYTDQYAAFDENALLLLFEELQERFLDGNHLEAYVYMLQRFLTKLEARTITMQSSIMRTEPEDIWLKAVVYRCLIENCSRASSNDLSDKHIIMSAVQFVTEHSDKLHSQKELLSYQCIIPDAKMTHVINAVEYMNLLMTMLKCNPYELTLKNWDVIRVGLGHWILSLVKSMDLALLTIDQKTFYFAVHVFKLFAAVTQFFTEEKRNSSTELVQSVYDEWIHVFYHNSYLSLFKQFYRLCEFQDIPKEFTCCWHLFLSEIAKTLQTADNSVLYTFCKTSTTITLDHICNFLLKNLSHSMHSLRILSVYMLKQLTMHFVSDDLEVINKQNEQLEKEQPEPAKWHFLSRFEGYLTRYEALIYKYNKEFSFKLLEISEMTAINPQEALPYLMLWDCIIHACAKAPVALRSVYTTWLHKNKYEENLLHFLFRALPEGILKNYNTRQMNKNTFTSLNWTQLKEGNFTIERYACHLYRETLSKLPALVRKWWNESSARQKTFVDTLTANFVSPIICHEELMSIASKKEKHDNMQITVHTSTREVLAVYSIDEVRMELVITLAVNYPLGAVKVECNKQIGGRASSRNIAMQLTIFLTHQNGTILDGLAMWKNNLDKKFEGIEECYVCYTVIHQDTCQLPKLTCKTCKKKFHGPCLYKWFTTSNKSTCPICRNVF